MHLKKGYKGCQLNNQYNKSTQALIFFKHNCIFVNGIHFDLSIKLYIGIKGHQTIKILTSLDVSQIL